MTRGLLVFVGALVLSRVVRWLLSRHQARMRATADALIGRPIYRDGFDVADDSLRLASTARRTRADQLKREGRQIETRDDARSKIHLAGQR